MEQTLELRRPLVCTEPVHRGSYQNQKQKSHTRAKSSSDISHRAWTKRVPSRVSAHNHARHQKPGLPSPENQGCSEQKRGRFHGSRANPCSIFPHSSTAKRSGRSAVAAIDASLEGSLSVTTSTSEGIPRACTFLTKPRRGSSQSEQNKNAAAHFRNMAQHKPLVVSGTIARAKVGPKPGFPVAVPHVRFRDPR